jgi:hypothetical protein
MHGGRTAGGGIGSGGVVATATARADSGDQQREDRQQRDAGNGATAAKASLVLQPWGVLDRHIKIP